MCLLAAPRAGRGTSRGHPWGGVTRVLNPPPARAQLSSFYFYFLLIFFRSARCLRPGVGGCPGHPACWKHPLFGLFSPRFFMAYFAPRILSHPFSHNHPPAPDANAPENPRPWQIPWDGGRPPAPTRLPGAPRAPPALFNLLGGDAAPTLGVTLGAGWNKRIEKTWRCGLSSAWLFSGKGSGDVGI